MNRLRSRGFGVVVSLGRALARRELLRVKKAFGNVRTCPVCHVPRSSAAKDEALVHGPECERDTMIAASGARGEPDVELP